jgi:hypothetical protein
MGFWGFSDPMLDSGAVAFRAVLNRQHDDGPEYGGAERRPGMAETTEKCWMETISAEGGELLEHVKRLLQEGNVRRIVIKQGKDTVVEFPLTVGVAGALIAPWLAAAGAIAALITDCTIEVERAGEASAETKLDRAAA